MEALTGEFFVATFERKEPTQFSELAQIPDNGNIIQCFLIYSTTFLSAIWCFSDLDIFSKFTTYVSRAETMVPGFAFLSVVTWNNRPSREDVVKDIACRLSLVVNGRSGYTSLLVCWLEKKAADDKISRY